MKRLYTIVILLLITFCSQVLAQGTINGRIADINGEPLIGASILEKGTTNGVVTDINGNYTIQVNGAGSILVFSYIGFVAQEILVGTQTTINVTLDEDLQQLEEVVVTALGFEANKDELGYANSTISNKTLTDASETSLINSLSGKTSGVRISRNSGDPGAGAYMQIRGISTLQQNSQPLIIVDGIPINNDSRGTNNNFAVQSRLNDINPNDIENVTVLKGASAAALWGTQAEVRCTLYYNKRRKVQSENEGYV